MVFPTVHENPYLKYNKQKNQTSKLVGDDQIYMEFDLFIIFYFFLPYLLAAHVGGPPESSVELDHLQEKQR